MQFQPINCFIIKSKPSIFLILKKYAMILDVFNFFVKIIIALIVLLIKDVLSSNNYYENQIVTINLSKSSLKMLFFSCSFFKISPFIYF